MDYKLFATLTGAVSTGVQIGPGQRFAIQPDVAAYVVTGVLGGAATSANGIKVAADGFYEGQTSSNTHVFVIPAAGSMSTKVFLG